MATPSEITDIILTSGNTFHAKVARWFLDHGWNVEISPYYMDQTQGKAREIDLVVEKIVDRPIGFADNPKGLVVIRLYIECKFVPSSTVFWFADKDLVSAENLVCKGGVFRHSNSYTKKHHYLSVKKVAKIFATANKKGAEAEPFYKALNQTLNAMVSMKNRPISIQKIRNTQIQKHVLEFPVVLCSSFNPLYSVNFFEDLEPQAIDENFQLEVRYAYVDHSGNSQKLIIFY